MSKLKNGTMTQEQLITLTKMEIITTSGQNFGYSEHQMMQHYNSVDEEKLDLVDGKDKQSDLNHRNLLNYNQVCLYPNEYLEKLHPKFKKSLIEENRSSWNYLLSQVKEEKYPISLFLKYTYDTQTYRNLTNDNNKNCLTKNLIDTL